jgi:hypothetical protein
VISRRQQHYHSQRRDNHEQHQRPVSNFYEYESVQGVMRSNQYRNEVVRSNQLHDEGTKSIQHRDEAMRSKQHRDDSMRTNQHQEEGQRPSKNNDDALRASEHQHRTAVTVDNISNSLQRRTQLQDNRGANNKNNSKYFIICVLWLFNIKLKYVYHNYH